MNFLLIFASRIFKFLNYLTPGLRMHILGRGRRIASRFLPSDLYLKLEKKARRAFGSHGSLSNYMYSSAPKRRSAKYTAVRMPVKPLEELDVAIVCAFTGREETMRISIRESYRSQCNIAWFLMGSSDADKDIIERLSVDYKNIYGAICKNRPLGAKWQAAVDFARLLTYHPKSLCVLGSDDIIAAEGYNFVVRQIKLSQELVAIEHFTEPPVLYATADWNVLDADGSSRLYGSLFTCKYKSDKLPCQPIGSGRFYCALYLDDIDYFLFDGKLGRNLDNWGFEGAVLAERDFVSLSGDELPILSVKTGTEMNSFYNIVDADHIEAVELVFEQKDAYFQKFDSAIFRGLDLS